MFRSLLAVILLPVLAALCLGGDLPPGAVAHLGSARFQNVGRITAIAFSPDGRALAAGAWDGSVLLWDVATGKPRGPCAGHGWQVQAVAFSPDGKVLATSGREREVRLWDASTGKLLRALGSFKRPITGVAWAPDSDRLAIQTQDAGLHLASPTGDKEPRTLEQKAAPYCPVFFTADGKQLLVVNEEQENKTIIFWDVAANKVARRFAGPSWCRGLAFAPDRSLLAATGVDREVHLWDVAAGKALAPLRLKDIDYAWLTFSPDGRSLAYAQGDGSLTMLELATNQVRCRFQDPLHTPARFCFSPDGRLLASGSLDLTAFVWDVSGQAAKPVELTAEELRKLWADLASTDAAVAHRALWKLTADPARSVTFLRTQLEPAPRIEQQRLARLLRDLDSEDFTRRQQASAELEKLAEQVEPALRQALEHGPSPESRRRLEELLEKAETGTSERLRRLRAIESLEHTEGHEARKLLEALAKGAPGAWITREAETSVKRLDRAAAGGR